MWTNTIVIQYSYRVCTSTCSNKCMYIVYDLRYMYYYVYSILLILRNCENIQDNCTQCKVYEYCPWIHLCTNTSINLYQKPGRMRCRGCGARAPSWVPPSRRARKRGRCARRPRHTTARAARGTPSRRCSAATRVRSRRLNRADTGRRGATGRTRAPGGQPHSSRTALAASAMDMYNEKIM